jgi:hypothetical protein
VALAHHRDPALRQIAFRTVFKLLEGHVSLRPGVKSAGLSGAR